VAYIGVKPTIGNFQICDAISVVNGQAAYTMQVGSVNVSPQSANHMIVSLNGVIQKPGSSYTVSGNTITFASNLATGDVIDFIQILGDVLDLGVPSDATVTAAKLNNDIISGQTALTSAPDSTDELLISDGGTLKRIDVSLIGGDNTPAFRVTNSSVQSIPNNTWTKVTFDTEDYDTDTAFSSSTFTVPTGEAGKYIFNWIVYSEVDSGEGVSSRLYINSSADNKTYARAMSSGSGEATLNTASVNVSLSAADTVELYMYQNKGSAQNNNVSYTYFSGFKLIGV